MWLLFGTVVAVVIIGLIGSEAPIDAVLITSGATAALILLCYALSPRVTISIAEGTVRSKKGTFPFSAIAEVRFIHWSRAGHSAEFFREDGKRLATVALTRTVFATATTEQWIALRHVVRAAASARSNRPKTKPLPPPGSISPLRFPLNVKIFTLDHVLHILDAQINWVMAGKKPSSQKAPFATLSRAVVYMG